MCRWYSPTANANDWYFLGILKRSHSALIIGKPAFSCPRWEGKISSGVTALPRSCTNEAKRTKGSLVSRAACSSTIIVCTPVSISGWYLAVCGTPYKAWISGKTRSRAPHSRSTSKKTWGASVSKALRISAQTRSGTSASTSPLITISFIKVMVSGAIVKLKRAAKRAARRMRTGSSKNALDTWRIMPAARSAWPLWKSITLPSWSSAMALMVMSLRSRSCSSVMSWEALNWKPW